MAIPVAGPLSDGVAGCLVNQHAQLKIRILTGL
jgi:hypothetical protein